YIHGETTALWLHAVRQYYDFTGDEKLLTDLRQNLYKAHDWLAREMEIGKGVPTNASAGMGASEIGPLRQNLYSDMYLAATAAIAMQDYAVLAEVHRNGLLQKSSEELARKAKDRIANDFWSEKLQSYAHALLIDNQLSDERTVWPAVAVMYGLVDGERATKTMEWIDSDLLTTPWGTRILSKDSKYYDPKGYNSGAVWPFVTGLAALADFQIGRADEGYKKVKAVASLTFSEALGRTPEVLSGSRPRSLDTSVPHQLFSSMAVVAPVMDGIFGYKPNAGANKILLQPCFPTGWKTAKAEKLLFGKTTFDSKIDRDADSYHVLVTWRGENPPEFDLKPKNGKPGKLQIMSAK
ncbi:MAG: MGH1-like glycoside hydrolase domain-containing protein, partial [Planctomycetota bacterium]